MKGLRGKGGEGLLFIFKLRKMYFKKLTY